MKLFRFLKLRKQVPVGFVDYDSDTIARLFDIDAQVAKCLVREYHDLLDGVDYVGSNIGHSDLFGLSKAISSKFGTAPATSVPKYPCIFPLMRGLHEIFNPQVRALGCKKVV